MKSAPVGRCIYCGCNQDLTEEHVIPYGLKGDFILPDASCQTCSDVTSDMEDVVQHVHLTGPRLALGYPSRHARRRGTMPPPPQVLGSRSDGSIAPLEFPPEQHPLLLWLPQYEVPGCLSGRQVAGVAMTFAPLLIFIVGGSIASVFESRAIGFPVAAIIFLCLPGFGTLAVAAVNNCRNEQRRIEFGTASNFALANMLLVSLGSVVVFPLALFFLEGVGSLLHLVTTSDVAVIWTLMVLGVVFFVGVALRFWWMLAMRQHVSDGAMHPRHKLVLMGVGVRATHIAMNRVRRR